MLQNVFGGLKAWESTLYSFALIFSAIVSGIFLHALTFHFLDRGSRLGWLPIDHRLLDRWVSPVRLMLPLLLIIFVSPYLWLHVEIKEVLRHILTLGFIASATWLLINTVLGLREVILSRYDLVVTDNLKARRVHTQINGLVRTSLVVLVILAVAVALMTFPQIRKVGFSILASAGIIGIIVGIAAQRSIANLIAGIQIAISQPIRIDDVVIVEGEWGVIEKITLTYVVVRIWDLRRLVVPIIFFLEKPFQNWTHVSSNLVGAVTLHVDYTLPVEAVREELHRILGASPLWNGKAWSLHVTEATQHSIELRALVSADNAGNLWELRCHVRERLVEFVNRLYPQCLPRIRTDIQHQKPTS
ncbi:mechanosensitive ion channel family protein [Geobacter sp. DSM 9736]|uniref:mechanosensitive ion channel family protein n=1 Tax=Geobacter sp. DSM 9736 TaxID=1277350 RepID=UPI000B50309D|nr:mechanosensitive ion channel domain-containing protein [Geobacter sp. DSM 9736]SNB47296.1 Small-conductance mechanosensitive channel [Geobacter sp. DSM 9736]